MQRSMGWTDWLHPQGEFGNQGEAAPAAAEQAHQVVAGHVLDHTATSPGGGAIAAQQPDPDDLIAHPEVSLAKTAGQAPGHQTTNAPHTLGLVEAATSGPVDRQPLALLLEDGLQIAEMQACFHRDRQVVDGMVDDLVQLAAAQLSRFACQRRSPVQTSAQTTWNPGCGVLMQLMHQRDQLIVCGGGMGHVTMVP